MLLFKAKLGNVNRMISWKLIITPQSSLKLSQIINFLQKKKKEKLGVLGDVIINYFQQIFIECLLYVKHHSRCWEYSTNMIEKMHIL